MSDKREEIYPPRYTYWYWNDVYSIDELKQLHEVFEKNHDKHATDNPASDAVKTSKLKMTTWLNLKDKLCHIEQSLLMVNSLHFGLNVWPQYDTQQIILNEYDCNIKGEYGWHKDSSDNHVYDIKFTLLINASLEPYEGGEFYLFNSKGGEHVKELNKPGNVIAFISHNYHKVTPVTKGKRHSITMFYTGPRFI